MLRIVRVDEVIDRNKLKIFRYLNINNIRKVDVSITPMVIKAVIQDDMGFDYYIFEDHDGQFKPSDPPEKCIQYVLAKRILELNI